MEAVGTQKAPAGAHLRAPAKGRVSTFEATPRKLSALPGDAGPRERTLIYFWQSISNLASMLLACLVAALSVCSSRAEGAVTAGCENQTGFVIRG
jgi:hypothetical protein